MTFGVIDNTQAASDGVARLMTRREYLLSRFGVMWTRFSRRFPRLVCFGQEIDVTITFTQAGLGTSRGALDDVEDSLQLLGIGFDRGSGFDGRDWEWDWSLKGPVRVVFRGAAKKPHLRRERPKPIVAVDNTVF